MKEAKELLKIAREVMSTDVPYWVLPEFIHKLNTSGTMLKKYTGTYQGVPTWFLKGDSKIYRDCYGWVSVNWTINPVLAGREWTIESSMSFAPASNGSFANEKFEEFKKVVTISGNSETAMFGVVRKTLSVFPTDDNVASEINILIGRHGGELAKAKKFWKQQAILFKQQYGGLSCS